MPVSDKSDYFGILSCTKEWTLSFDKLFMKLSSVDYSVVVGVETLGLAVAGVIADRSRCPMIPVRKMSHRVRDYEIVGYRHYSKQYCYMGIKRMSLHDQRVLIADDTIRTGLQADAVCKIIRKMGGDPVAIACLIDFQKMRNEGLVKDIPVIASICVDDDSSWEKQ